LPTWQTTEFNCAGPLGGFRHASGSQLGTVEVVCVDMQLKQSGSPNNVGCNA
jgi:hypothetical protein